MCKNVMVVYVCIFRINSFKLSKCNIDDMKTRAILMYVLHLKLKKILEKMHIFAHLGKIQNLC